MSDYNSALMGAHFRGYAVKELVKGYVIGKKLECRRDPGNAYDPNAIMLIDPEENDEHVGFIERGLAEELAPLLDEGRTLEAEVSGFMLPTKPYLDLNWVEEKDAGFPEDEEFPEDED